MSGAYIMEHTCKIPQIKLKFICFLPLALSMSTTVNCRQRAYRGYPILCSGWPLLPWGSPVYYYLRPRTGHYLCPSLMCIVTREGSSVPDATLKMKRKMKWYEYYLWNCFDTLPLFTEDIEETVGCEPTLSTFQMIWSYNICLVMVVYHQFTPPIMVDGAPYHDWGPRLPCVG